MVGETCDLVKVKNLELTIRRCLRVHADMLRKDDEN